MPKAEVTSEEEAPEVLPLLPLLPDDEEPLLPDELEPVAAAPAAVLEPRADVAMEPEAEAEDELEAADDEETSDLMPLEMEAVVWQFEVLGVEYAPVGVVWSAAPLVYE